MRTPVEAAVAGSGDLSTANLQARTVRIAMQGSGRADVRASERLDARVTGSGLVVYRGKPKVSRTVLGTGAVRAGRRLGTAPPGRGWPAATPCRSRARAAPQKLE